MGVLGWLVGKACKTRPTVPFRREQREIYQWQIDCVCDLHDIRRPMPKSFGLLAGTQAEVLARLTQDVSLPNYSVTEEYEHIQRVTNYTFYDARQALVQRGAIRCVSRNMVLKRIVEPSSSLCGDPFRDNPFIVETPDVTLGRVSFHPIKPQAHFIVEE